jgi:hypothetical protein
MWKIRIAAGLRRTKKSYTPQVSHSPVVGGQSAGGRLIAGGGVWPKLPG